MKVMNLAARLSTTALPLSTTSSTQQTTTSASSLSSLLPPFDPSTTFRRIFLVRHGETDWNQRGLMQGGGFDIPLNANGHIQAVSVSKELATMPVDVVVSSHLQRSQQTAHVIRQEITMNNDKDDARLVLPSVVSMSEFGEMRFGALEGNAIRGSEATPETIENFRVHSERMKGDMDFAWPGEEGESTRQVEYRSRRGLERLHENFPDAKSVVVVAHGRLNKVLLASLLYGDALRYSEVEQGNTCINVVDHQVDGSYQKLLLSYMGHLANHDE